MKNADMPIYPTSESIEHCGIDGSSGPYVTEVAHAGLTKREHFAAMAMQGFLSNSWQAKELDGTGDSSGEQMAIVAEISVKIADALLAELEAK